MAEDDLRIFMGSISALLFDPRVAVERTTEGFFICRVREGAGQVEELVIYFVQAPQLLVQMTKDEAEQAAIRRARSQWPEEMGWTHHDVTLVEIPRSMFIKNQLFISLRELYDKVLRLTGFA